MKTVDEWLDEYGDSHKNRTNKIIHWIFIPQIVFSLIGMLWVIPVPWAREALPFVNWGSLFIAFALIWYIRLSIPLFLAFALLSAGIIVGNHFIFQAVNENKLIQLGISGAVFVLSWLGQFIGHEIEGKKPSFFKDLQFFLIGPAWLLHFVLKKMGLPYKNN